MMPLDRIVRIGKYEFLATPGIMIRRKVAENLWPYWVYAGFWLILAVSYVLQHDWLHAVLDASLAVLSAWSGYRRLNAAPDQTELIAERDGRWVVRGEDAGEAEGASVLVKTSGRRHLVLLSCRDRDKPHLIWWTLKRPDAERLRDVIETILPTRAGSGVWPPAPAYREND